MADTLRIPKIGPASRGQRMTLDDFTRAEEQPGYIYELEKGVVVVFDVPRVPHMSLVLRLRNALVAYQLANPSRVHSITGTGESAMCMPQMQSVRHPDISVYLTPPPSADDQPWEDWIPEMVIEVVSESDAERDYRTKRDEYLKAGVNVYWIMDPRNRTATILTRRADTWREQKLDATGILTTSRLPGFELKLTELFAVLG
jgi:Uma2 family endonuclease